MSRDKVGRARGVRSKEEMVSVMLELGFTWEWLDGEILRATTPVIPAVRSASGRKVFFNQLIASTANALEFGCADTSDSIDGMEVTQEALDKCVCFGDNTPVDLSVLLYGKQVAEELAVDLQWQRCDVALLDNYLVMHARRLWEGPVKDR